MKYVSSVCSDAGIVKRVNQDAALVCQAETSKGTVLFAAICDGMGGLEQGEVASSTVVSGMSKWFETSFPDIFYHDCTSEHIRHSLQREIHSLNRRICAYGEERGIHLGTTLVLLLLVNGFYYICNVGDSRIYYLKDGIWQITQDQTYVQRQIELGRMTEEESRTSSKRHILLQCIGTGRAVEADFYTGEYHGNSCFLLCSDGFRNVITKQEMWDLLDPDKLEKDMVKEGGESGKQNTAWTEGFPSPKDMDRKVKQLVETVKSRQEEDNITAVLIHVL